MNIEVLRLGHRPQRDKRITTHVCLTARALGARAVHIAEEDPSVAANVRDVVRRFGGPFQVRHGAGWRPVLRTWGGQVIHLTMYGRGLSESLPAIRDDGRDALVVVGAEKVPGEVYDAADHNVAVGHQPHSEVAALAILLDRLGEGRWEKDVFSGAEMQVVPQERGKLLRRDRTAQ